MRYRELGRPGVRVSEVGLGTAQLSNTSGQVDGVRYMPPDDARRILRASLECGLTFFDTGDNYGDAEVLLGELPDAEKASITIATKAGLQANLVRDFSIPYIRQQVDRSLARLNVERLGLFQLNKPALRVLEDGMLFELLAELKASGKAALTGVVVGEAATGFLAVDSGTVDCLQVLYNLMYQETRPLIAYAAERGVGIIVRSPLNSGLLSGAYSRRTVFPASDERSRYFSGAAFERRLAALDEIQRALGLERERLTEFALRFVLSTPGVSVVIPGASTLGQLRDYVSATDQDPFTSAEMQHIARVVEACSEDVQRVFQN